MAIKMRYLHKAKNPKIVALGEQFVQKYDLKDNKNAFDIIPPAYSCENERLVILAVSGKGEPDDVLRRFCSELNKKKAQNVALLVDGDEKLGNRLLGVLKETGTNVSENVKYIKIGGLPFLGGKVSDAEKQDLVAWVQSIIDNLQ